MRSGPPAALDAAPAPGKGGGGGAPPGGMGGGGGGGAVPVGKGGGGGTPALLSGNGGAGGGGAEELGKGGAGGGELGLAILAGLPGTEEEPLLSSDERGRGGPMVPKRREASCLAPPPVRWSSSSSDSSAEDSTTDQSSSSGRARVRGGVGALATLSWVRRWKGFVETGSVGGVGVAAVPFACGFFIRNGFLVSSIGAAGLVMEGLLTACEFGSCTVGSGAGTLGTGGGFGVVSRVSS